VCGQPGYEASAVQYKTSRAMTKDIMAKMMPGEKIHKIDMHEG
jgi:CheY-specific phosphatase CheX